MITVPFGVTGRPVAIHRWRAGLRPARSPARHPFAVLGFQLSGELQVEQGGPLTLRPGDVYIIPPGHAHRVTGGTDVEMWMIAFSPASLDRHRFAPVLAPLDAITRGALPRVTIPEERRGFVGALYAELGRQEASSPLRAESLLALLLEEVAAHATPSNRMLSASSEPAKAGDLAGRAVSYIATHALGSISLADVAQALGRNRTHIADVVRRATGQTVGEIIADVRLDEARRRLQETDELVEVIGERVGYADPTHFARTFKRRYGLAPRAWRARN